jgi:uncharacterized protein Veg
MHEEKNLGQRKRMKRRLQNGELHNLYSSIFLEQLNKRR